MRGMWFCALAVFMLAGCGAGGGPVIPVNGIVFWDNDPLDAATVTFYPEDKSQKTIGSARTGSDGKFVILETKGQKGLAAGKYKVTVSKMKLPGGAGGGPNDDPPIAAVTDIDVKNDLPAIYSDPNKTILAYTVTGDGKPIEIKLSSKKK